MSPRRRVGVRLPGSQGRPGRGGRREGEGREAAAVQPSIRGPNPGTPA